MSARQPELVLRIFEVLEESSGGLTREQILRAIESDEQITVRQLRILSDQSLVQSTMRAGTEIFSLPEEIRRVLTYFDANPEGLTIETLAEKISRELPDAARVLDALCEAGLIGMQTRDKKEIYTRARPTNIIREQKIRQNKRSFGTCGDIGIVLSDDFDGSGKGWHERPSAIRTRSRRTGPETVEGIDDSGQSGRSFSFDSESSGSPLSPAICEASHDRVVNTLFAPKDAPDTIINDNLQPLKPGSDYFFCLDIGKWVAGSLESNPVDIPDVPENANLLIAIFRFNDGLGIIRGADTGELLVQSDGSVTVSRQPIAREESWPVSAHIRTRLFFPVHTPPAQGRCRLRCNIYFRQVLLQSRLVTILVAKEPDGKKALGSELEYTLTKNLNPAHVSQFAEHRLSILLNSSAEGTHNLYLCASDSKESVIDKVDIDREKFRSIIDITRGTLRVVSWGNTGEWNENVIDKYNDDEKKSTRQEKLLHLQKDLFNMAVLGYNIYALFDQDFLTKFEKNTLPARQHPGCHERQAGVLFPGSLRLRLSRPGRVQ